MSSAPWSLHLLGEVLSAFSVDSPTALRDVVSRVAEAVDAEITAILRHDSFSLCTGLTQDEKGRLLELVPSRSDRLVLEGTTYHLHWSPLGGDQLLVVGRANTAYDLEERALLRGMGRSIELSTRVLDAVRAQREALQAEKLAKEAAIREATIDHLTGLPNRRELLRQLRERLRRVAEDQGQQTVLFIDLDHFKQVNDLHGHRAGDQVLRVVADHLRAMTRAGDVVGRMSGDEFVMLCSLPAAADAERLATRILDALRESLQSQGMAIASAAASIGIAVAEAGDTPDTLLDNADMAMYAAKQRGRGRCARYLPSMREQLAERHRLEEELRQGLAGDQMRAWLQPIVSTAHGGVVGFEALVRWQHPQRGLLSPDRFLAVAEEADLLRDIDAAVLSDACIQVSRWQTSRKGLLPRLSVNVSAVSLADRRLHERVSRTLEVTGFPAANLFLEITETTLVDDLVSASVNITELERLGIRLAIDDFGTGYSSLSYLKRFPVGILKIDRSFISGLGGGSEDDVIVETVVKMARSLGLEVVAEGVETAAQVERLRLFGCHYLQGYLYGAPAAAEVSEARYRASLDAQLGMVLQS